MAATPLVHFLDEQRRHRRTSALSAALVVAALAVSGFPLSILISPLLVAVVAVPVRLADLVLDVPPGLTAGLDRVFHLLPTVWAAVRRPDVELPWDWLVGLFVLPGIVATLLLWLLVRVTFRRTGVGGVLRRMETRPPRPGDLGEQRAVNLVHEVAVAAGVPPPRVVLIDTPAANVATAGLRMDDATVVVTRGFIERLPRDAQQAVIAQVMASTGNGDLTLAAEILTLLQTWGLIALLLEAPFLPTSRANLVLIARIVRQALRGEADVSSREVALDRLLAGAGHEHDMSSEELEMLPNLHPLVLLFAYLPLLVTVGLVAIFSKTVIWLTALLIGPLVALLWRARRRLADATTVQLTRHPDALARALRTLSGLDVTVPGAVAVHFLFPIWDPAVDRDEKRTDVTSTLLHLQLPLEPRLRRLERLGASAEHRAAVPTAPAGATVREVAAGAGWLAVAALFLGLVLALSAVAAAGVLYGIGWMLQVVLVAPHQGTQPSGAVDRGGVVGTLPTLPMATPMTSSPTAGRSDGCKRPAGARLYRADPGGRPMFTHDEVTQSPTERGAPAPGEAPSSLAEPGRVHLVVVSTRAVRPGETAPSGAVLQTRFWHPRDRRWSENFFESLDHALHLFVEESGWVLRQRQALDQPHAHEVIFEARRQDFSRPSTEEMLRDVGLTARDVAGLIERVDAERRS